MQPYKILIKNGAFSPWGVGGQYVRLDSSAVEVKVRDPASGSFVYLTQGKSARFPVPFDSLELEQNSGADVQVVMTIASGGEILSPDVSGDVSVVSGASISTVADIAVGAGATVLISAANSSRKFADFVCSTNYRWGNANIGAARGVSVPAGVISRVETTGAIYVYSAAGGTVSLTEILE